MQAVERELPTRAAEDFSFFIEQVPGAMCFLGVDVCIRCFHYITLSDGAGTGCRHAAFFHLQAGRGSPSHGSCTACVHGAAAFAGA